MNWFETICWIILFVCLFVSLFNAYRWNKLIDKSSNKVATRQVRVRPLKPMQIFDVELGEFVALTPLYTYPFERTLDKKYIIVFGIVVESKLFLEVTCDEKI